MNQTILMTLEEVQQEKEQRKKEVQRKIRESLFQQWRELRRKFSSGHCKIICDCANCTKRRQVAAGLNLPYATPTSGEYLEAVA